MNASLNSDDRSELAMLITDPAPFLKTSTADNRRLAVAASLTHPSLIPELEGMLEADPDASVRRECAEVLGLSGRGRTDLLKRVLSHDDSAQVREAAATALGEIADGTSVDDLMEHASDQGEDKLVREAAVAALGAIGDERAVPLLLELLKTGPPQIRRRCVPALSVFDGDSVEEALHLAAKDRNPMVREAAEMVVGRSTD